MRIIALILLSLGLVLGGCSKSSDSSGAKSAKTSKKKKKKKGADGAKKSKSSYSGGDVANGGTISGSVTFAGDTKDGTVTFTKDKEVCKSADGTDKAPEGALVIADGKLKNAVVSLDGVKRRL